MARKLRLPSRELTLRLVSSIVVGPPVLWIAYHGGLPASILAGLVAVIAVIEWIRLSGAEFELAFWYMTVSQVITVAAAIIYGAGAGYAMAVGLMAIGWWISKLAIPRLVMPRLAMLGSIYCGVFASSVVGLCAPSAPALALPWLLGVVWSSDIGAYVVGRLFGGPKLAPTISPGKTWSGMAGSVVGAAIAGMVCVLLGATDFSVQEAAVVGALLGVVGQCGDLLESALKRRAGVKDSGKLIPGHGGMLDRIDALMACAPVLLSVISIPNL